ncbi:unnamed protein product [Gongylonema pulchrum]|uniref:Collagen-like protein n=1 Tax=Gongylonema pulchrum TaxID=637853 RepID=A0A183EZ62_9BILA|nr:unnamed protein product [Gongylonema pulchrum]
MMGKTGEKGGRGTDGMDEEREDNAEQTIAIISECEAKLLHTSEQQQTSQIQELAFILKGYYYYCYCKYYYYSVAIED